MPSSWCKVDPELLTSNTYTVGPNKAMFVLFAGSARLNFLPRNCFSKAKIMTHQKRREREEQ